MRALVFHQQGGIENLSFQPEFPKPELKPGEALVRIKAAALNHLDLWVLQGSPAYQTPLPHISGCEGAGVIEKIHGESLQLKPGDEVIISPGQPCFHCSPCRSGEESTCLHWKIFGAHTQGAFADYAAVPLQHLIRKPESISFETAAAYPLSYMTAWHMLISRGKLRAGEKVLIIGAGSGIGSAAIQIAKLAGAIVIAGTSHSDKASACREMGADEVIDTTDRDFFTQVLDLTAGEGVHLVFEHVGPATFGSSLRSLRRNGRLVICGVTTGPIAELDLRFLFSRQISVIGSMLGTRNELLQVTELVERGVLNPRIDSIFPLEKAIEGYALMKQGAQFGKIVFQI
jgi:NADPH:quinone reductase-like Zn-dependent oxidoreductase